MKESLQSVEKEGNDVLKHQHNINLNARIVQISDNV